jgi:hypothetical protein
MTQILKTKQLSFGITGDSYTLVNDIPLSEEKIGAVTEPSRPTSPAVKDTISDLMAELPKNSNPAALHQVHFKIPLYNCALSSTTSRVAFDSPIDGRKQPDVSLSTSHVVKKATLRVATLYNRFLRPLTLWGSQFVYPVCEYERRLGIVPSDKKDKF